MQHWVWIVVFNLLTYLPIPKQMEFRLLKVRPFSDLTFWRPART